MIFWFLFGICIGVGLLGWLCLKAQTQIRLLEEDKQLVHQEKHIVVDFLHHLIEGLGEGISKDELFDRVVHGLVHSLTASSACLFERTEENRFQRMAAEGLFPPLRELSEAKLKGSRVELFEDVLADESFGSAEGLIGMVARSGEALIIKNASEDPRVVQHQDPSLKITSIIVAPIVFSQEILGVLAVANPIDGSEFNDADLSLVESFAEQAGLVMHNCALIEIQQQKQKIDFDLSVASSIQRMILPKKLPELECLELAAFYHPAQQVGGDLYSTFKLDDHRIALAVADVSGKGVSASLLMSICQTNLRHFASQVGSPAELLMRLNTEMEANVREDMFITMLYAIVDTQNNTLSFSRAGHEKLLVLSKREANARFVSGSGMAIGMVPNALFNSSIEDVILPFEPEDIAVFYTDGISECLNTQGEEFSSARLAAVVENLRGASADVIAKGILSSAENFANKEPFGDDLTLIAIKRS